MVHDDWLLTAERAAVHLPTATAVLADLHLGYEHARRRGGEAVPLANIAEVSARIRSLCAKHAVERLVIAGDLCEDGRSPGPVAELLEGLRQDRIELLGIVPGNHDRKLAADLPVLVESIKVGRWQVIHGDRPARGWVVQGHAHPCLRWAGIVAPCFLVGPRRLVLPAFSADAAGVNVLRQPEWRTYRCGVIVGDQVRDFGIVARLGRGPTRPNRKRGPKPPFSPPPRRA
jgi:hypothetical protein